MWLEYSRHCIADYLSMICVKVSHITSTMNPIQKIHGNSKMLPMESIEKEICDELVHSLYEMGVNRSDRDHTQFRKWAIRDCKAYLSKVSDEQLDYQSLKTQKFPKNSNDAYEHVLRHDDVPELCYT